MLRIKIFIYFIRYCCSLGKNPWNFFQIHKNFFNEEKGIFSKFDITQRIPQKWRLKEIRLDPKRSTTNRKEIISKNFKSPVFLKPEWGQNSHGIHRVDIIENTDYLLTEIKELQIPYTCQEGALGKKEFEIYYIRSQKNPQEFSVFSITETINTIPEKYHIEGIHNGSIYKDYSSQLSSLEKNKIKKMMLQMWEYSMARVGVKADSLTSIARWEFKVFEINIFLPLLLALMDETLSSETRNLMAKNFAKQLVCIIPDSKDIQKKKIFWNMMKIHSLTSKKTW